MYMSANLPVTEYDLNDRWLSNISENNELFLWIMGSNPIKTINLVLAFKSSYLAKNHNKKISQNFQNKTQCCQTTAVLSVN